MYTPVLKHEHRSIHSPESMKLIKNKYTQNIRDPLTRLLTQTHKMEREQKRTEEKRKEDKKKTLAYPQSPSPPLPPPNKPVGNQSLFLLLDTEARIPRLPSSHKINPRQFILISNR